MLAAYQNLVRTRLPRSLTVAGITVTVVLCAGAALAVLGLRDQAWTQADIGAETLLNSLTRTLARDFELYDLSLQAVTERLRDPVLEGVSPRLQHLALFDHAATAAGYGAIFVLDANGNSYIDSGSLIPRRVNGADRAYFQAQRDADVGLYVGRPWRTRISGREMIPLSRRFSYADGNFAGVVVGAIELAYFETVFARLNRSLNLRITVLFDNRVATDVDRKPAQYPDVGFFDPQTLTALEQAEHVTLIAPASGAPALHVARQVGTLPMRVVVSMPVAAIDAAWHGRATLIVVIVGLLAVALLVLLRLLGREFERREAAEAELAALALTDPLTGIPNRRHFDRTLAEVERAAFRKRSALAIIDVDCFKAFNDHFGHPAGDRVLRAVGLELATCAAGAGGHAYRIGGEEFAILVTGIDEPGALDFARACSRRIAALAVPHVRSPFGVVTVSIGLIHTGRHPAASQAEWLSLADAALYEAKRGGRNQVRGPGAFGHGAECPSGASRAMTPEALLPA